MLPLEQNQFPNLNLSEHSQNYSMKPLFSIIELSSSRQ